MSTVNLEYLPQDFPPFSINQLENYTYTIMSSGETYKTLWKVSQTKQRVLNVFYEFLMPKNCVAFMSWAPLTPTSRNK